MRLTTGEAYQAGLPVVLPKTLQRGRLPRPRYVRKVVREVDRVLTFLRGHAEVVALAVKGRGSDGECWSLNYDCG